MDVPVIYEAEYRLAQIVWSCAPLSTRELVDKCFAQLGWKRTTTYTVLKKLCSRGVFRAENSVITVLIPEKQVQLSQSEAFLKRTFRGSLPGFIAAFADSKRLSAEDVQEIRRMIDEYEGRSDA
ncbi:MAG: BlaI/MecI/CopY family transcriptional regulator [Clostridia bacterium]|jgi:predicted transcriptional regulator|nr:BlaI/MecI/CopY family transcriptional regulator [Clostridia bacterium]MBR5380733.1 BlaI/MecI/CopY family transcriptional regulator [Clostridia bacterium]MBR5751234.1 BlaI/MecI/CopY family transcriptional regulator [Clostridia bacterium]